MQVNNNVQSPNFGMALKINKGARKALENLPMETIERLQKAGEELKDTKYYHVTVGDDLKANITADKNAYFGLFENKKYLASNGVEKVNGENVLSDRIVIINDKNTKRDIAGVSRYVPYGKTEPFFNTWGSFGPYEHVNDISQLTQVTKILDEVAAEKAYQKSVKLSAEKVEKENVTKAVDNLLDTFGE